MLNSFVVSGVSVWGESARQPPDRCVLCLVCVGACLAAQCDRRTHSDAERTCQSQSVPACQPPPPRRRPGRQRRLAARPPTRSDVVRHAKCKHAVDCCIWLNLNFFTKRHAMRVIYRQTVQILPDSLETQFTPPDTTQTGRSCLVWRAVWIGHYGEIGCCCNFLEHDMDHLVSGSIVNFLVSLSGIVTVILLLARMVLSHHHYHSDHTLTFIFSFFYSGFEKTAYQQQAAFSVYASNV